MYVDIKMYFKLFYHPPAAPSNPRVIFHRTPEPSTFPGSPSKPNVQEIGQTSMLLSWKANGNHGASPVEAYWVEYFSHETDEVRTYALRVCTSTVHYGKVDVVLLDVDEF